VAERLAGLFSRLDAQVLSAITIYSPSIEFADAGPFGPELSRFSSENRSVRSALS
jgi:hypothetical protein